MQQKWKSSSTPDSMKSDWLRGLQFLGKKKYIYICTRKIPGICFLYLYLEQIIFPFSPKGSMQGATIFLGNSKQMSYCNFSPYSHAALQLHWKSSHFSVLYYSPAEPLVNNDTPEIQIWNCKQSGWTNPIHQTLLRPVD